MNKLDSYPPKKMDTSKVILTTAHSRAITAMARGLALRLWEDKQLAEPLWLGSDVGSAQATAVAYLQHLHSEPDVWARFGTEATTQLALHREEWWAEYDAEEEKA